MLTNWRVMFFIGALPAVLVFFIRSGVEESPVWQAGQAQAVKRSLSRADVAKYAGTFLLLVVTMFAFTSLSHGSQDLYPTLLQKGKHFSPAHVGTIAVVANLGGLLGGICFGAWSERIGRRKGIIVAALLAVPMIPLWALTHSMVLVALGGFLMQFMVQGAWGIIPAHLNELSPAAVRATFPGFAYQLGNLLSSRNAKFQLAIARRSFGGSLQTVMALTIAAVALLVAVLAFLGTDARGRRMEVAD